MTNDPSTPDDSDADPAPLRNADAERATSEEGKKVPTGDVDHDAQPSTGASETDVEDD